MGNEKKGVSILTALNADEDYTVGPDEETFGTFDGVLPGGSGANTGIGLRRLGVDVHFIGRVGDDNNGDMLLNNLIKEGADVSNIQRVKGEKSGKCFVMIDEKGERGIYVFPEVNDEITINNKMYQLVENSKIFYTTNFACKKSTKSLETQIELAKHAKENKVVVGFSPGNLYSAKKFRENHPGKIETLLENTDILFGTANEIVDLVGLTGDIKSPSDYFMYRLGSIFRDYNIENVAITLGERGSVIINREKSSYDIPRRVVDKMGDTIGAGDAYAAGFLYGFLKN